MNDEDKKSKQDTHVFFASGNQITRHLHINHNHAMFIVCWEGFHDLIPIIDILSNVEIASLKKLKETCMQIYLAYYGEDFAEIDLNERIGSLQHLGIIEIKNVDDGNDDKQVFITQDFKKFITSGIKAFMLKPENSGDRNERNESRIQTT